MNIQQINLGLYPNDGSGDDLRTAFEKTISNFNEIDSKVVLFSANVGDGIPIAIETVLNNTIQFKTIKSGNDNLAISSDSTSLTLTVSDISLTELIDVSITNPQIGNSLVWNGTSWINETIETVVSLTELIDVSITSPQIGNSLVWNGTAWVNETRGVTKIVAGNNVTISPVSGEGEVTINATSSGTGIPEGFDFGQLSTPTNILELLIQATPVDFGSISTPNSLNLDLGPIVPAGESIYTLTSNVSQVVEGGSFVITLTSSNVPNGTLVPYTITGVTSSDINNASLTGNFSLNNGSATLTVQTTVDGLVEGTETFTLTLTGITPVVSVNVNIIDTAVETINGGSPGTITFTNVSNGGSTNETIFEDTLDGGGVVFVLFGDLIDGGIPSDTNFSAILDGENPLSSNLVIIDGGIVN